MSYKPRSLFTLIEDVNRNILLPHIQRPFVWEREQMSKLFDSLMRNYPIQTFLFWRTKEFIKARKFMESVEWDPDLSDYYDEARSAAGVEKTFVLDGQQRLQTLYALFAGSVRDTESGPDFLAYADVTAGEDADDGIVYPLKFATDSPGPEWYRLRDLREGDGSRNAEEIAEHVNERIDAARPDELADTRKTRERRVRRSIAQICSLLREERHFWVETLDGIAQPYPYRTVLDIFVRVNSGGTRLEPADLMFAAMKEGSPDIEERVEDMTALLNADGLAFDKSTVLKCLLVALGRGSEATPEKFEGDVGRQTLQQVDQAWPQAQAAFEQLRDFLLQDLRLSSDSLVRSYLAFIPVFDFFFHNPKPGDAAFASMRAYVYRAQLFNWFRARTDQILNTLHGVAGKPLDRQFPLAQITTHFSKETTELRSEHLLDNRLRVMLLHLVYVERFGSDPFKFKFRGNAPQIDHIYPQSLLRRDLNFGTADVNHLGNFRFVGAAENNRKRAEKPASYFARLKAAGAPIEKHLLVADYANDPTLLVWNREAYVAFRDRRLAEIEKIAKKVVNGAAPDLTP